MDKDTAVWIAMIVMTLVLLWGLSIIAWALKQAPKPKPANEGAQTAHLPAPAPLLLSILAEKPAPDAGEVKGSFSRTAGAFGAMAMAATLVGLSYWMLFDLFECNGADLKSAIQYTGWYFLAGAALFAPYAFNQLAKVFNLK